MAGLPEWNRATRLVVCCCHTGNTNMGKAATLCMAMALASAACSQPPRDSAGTTDRVERSGKVVLGEIAAVPRSPEADAALERVAGKLGATVERRSGYGEELLHQLERGEVDVVYGHFAQSSPWSKKVHLGTPLGRRKTVPSDEAVPRFAFRNGENGWIMRVEREIAP